MHPIPIPDALVEAYGSGWQRRVIAGPTGSLIGEGQGPGDAVAVEALCGHSMGWPAFILYERLDPGDLEKLRAGGLVRVVFFTNQMPVHSLAVIGEHDA